jgi:hypothetical protein
MEETKGFVSAKDALAALEQYQGCFFPHSAAVKIINQLSREDVEPVVYGHWIHKPLETDGDLWLYHCSACGNLSARPRAYCADCGAKMEEKVEYADD